MEERMSRWLVGLLLFAVLLTVTLAPVMAHVTPP
jgi:hypothetical protein